MPRINQFGLCASSTVSPYHSGVHDTLVTFARIPTNAISVPCSCLISDT